MRSLIAWFVGLGVLTCIAHAAIPVTDMYDGMPPVRFDRPVKVIVVYGRMDKCGKPKIANHPDAYFEACIRHGVTYLPDPCAYGNTETFARLACHEAAHRSGWPADHGE